MPSACLPSRKTLVAVIISGGALATAAPGTARAAQKPTPTHADAACGPGLHRRMDICLPLHFESNWGLSRPNHVMEMDYKVLSPTWALGFQKLASKAGGVCQVKYPGHPTENYSDIWDFIVRELKAASLTPDPSPLGEWGQG